MKQSNDQTLTRFWKIWFDQRDKVQKNWNMIQSRVFQVFHMSSTLKITKTGQKYIFTRIFSKNRWKSWQFWKFHTKIIKGEEAGKVVWVSQTRLPFTIQNSLSHFKLHFPPALPFFPQNSLLLIWKIPYSEIVGEVWVILLVFEALTASARQTSVIIHSIDRL